MEPCLRYDLTEGQSPAGATEEDIERVLAGLAATAHTLRCWVREAGPLLERLAEDHPSAAILVESLAVAETAPLHLGTPRHLEEAALEILRGLRDLSESAGCRALSSTG